MVEWQLVYTKQAIKDSKKIAQSGFKNKVTELLNILKINPYKTPPKYEKLIGDLQKAYSRRINIQHRLVYEILEDIKTVKVIRMWTHYD